MQSDSVCSTLNGLLLAMGVVLMAVGALLVWRGANLNFMG